MTTWSEDINDTKKDLYNNVGIEMAKNGIENNLALDQVTESIFKKIQAGLDEFIINSEDVLSKPVFENFSRKNLAFDTLGIALKAGVQIVELIKALNGDFSYSNLENILNNFNQAQTTQPIVIDPILVDLNGDGIKTTSVENGIYFDHQNDGFMETSAWVDENDWTIRSAA